MAETKTTTNTPETGSTPKTSHKNIKAALLQAKRDMGPVYKNASNPAFRSKYADLAQIVETIEGPLQDNDILLTQPLVMVDGKLHVETSLFHVPSETDIKSQVEVVSKDASDPQKVGGAITYYRRYDLLAVLGIAPEDDDGNMASQVAQRPIDHSASQPSNRPNIQASGQAASQGSAKPGDLPCEVPGCTLTVWKSKEAEVRGSHEGHIVCWQHDREDWQAQLAPATKPDVPSDPPVRCEIPGCDQFVRAAAVEQNQSIHDGHTICKEHSQNQANPWKALHPDYQDGQPAATISAEEEAEGVQDALNALGAEEVPA